MSSMESTVLAWLQKELQLYSELILIAPIRIEDNNSLEYLQGKPLLCLTHHYFPNSIPNLIEQLKEQDTTLFCCQIFYDKLGVNIPQLTDDKDWLNYLYQIHTGIESKRQEEITLRELHIGKNIETDEEQSHIVETMGDELLKSLNKLFHQTVELSSKEEENSSTSSSTSNTRSPSPRIHTARSIEEFSDSLDQSAVPMKSRLVTEDAIITITTTTTLTTTATLTRQEIESTLLSIESKELIEFYNMINDLSFAVKAHPNIAIYISAIDATHAAIHLQLHKGEILQSTIQFTNTASSIRNELEFIQAKMLKTTTTDVGIQDLESRVKSTGNWIHNLHDQFKDTSLFLADIDTQTEYQALLDKFNSISHWVDEVRIWFVEAERIRGWIEERIKILEEKPSLNPLDEIELEYEFETIQQLNGDQKLLEEDVEAFDREDMTRLRAHVKALTGGNKDLSPADTTTIEITFTTLMTLDRLMHLLRRYSYELQITTLRIYWEQEYSVAVAWVRSTLESLKLFVQQKARWRPSSDEHRQDIIDTLIDFEKQSSAFDGGQFTTTVNRYQDLDDACNIELPGHLESRQVAIEEQFEELTNRIAFARQVVEQYLVVSDFLDRVDKLKGEGEELRLQMTLAAEQHNNTNNSNNLNDFNEKVALFQENAVRLVTGVAARVPYPEATHPIDGQGNDDANEEIRLVISARKSSLVLFGEILDQSLNAYRRSLQLQKRGKQLRDEINRLLSWVDERMKSIKKSKVDVFVGKCALDDSDLSRLKKERDGQVSKMNGIKENEIKRLVENIQALKASSAQPPTNPNTVALVSDLHGGMEDLETQLEVLHDALQVHTLCLDILEKRISWETQHAKSSLWISDMTFQMWEFVSRKAQWRPDDSTHTVVPIDHSVLKADFDLMQNKVKAFHQDHLVLVDKTFTDLVNGFRIIIDRHDMVEEDQPPKDNITPEHVQRRQDSLNQSYLNLCDLLDFTEGVLSQQTSLTVFFSIVHTLKEKGLALISDIEKANENIMDLERAEESRQRFVISVQQFDNDTIELWMQHGAQLPYPQCPEDARATRPTTSDDDVSTEVATVVYETYTELQQLVKRITDTLQIFDISIVYRSRLEQWCIDANTFEKSVTELKENIECEHTFDLQSGTIIKEGQANDTVANCLKKSQDLEVQLTRLQTEKLDPLVCRLDELEKEIGLAQQQQHQEDAGKQGTVCNTCVTTSITEKSKNSLDDAWEALEGTVTLFTNRTILCDHASKWEKMWKEQWSFVNRLGDQVREWNNEKNVYQSAHQVEESNLLDTLVSNLENADVSLQTRLDKEFPPMKTLFEKMLTSYEEVQLSSEELDSYTSSLKSKDEELEKSVVKLQDMISSLRAESQLLKTRHEWELSVDHELKVLSEKALETESFIRQTARWSNANAEVVVSKDAAQPMHTACIVQKQKLSHLLDTLSELQKSSSLFQTESIFKKKIALESHIEKLEHGVDFVDQVLTQRFAIVSHLDSIAQLENQAESIKTQFLSANDTINDQEQQLIQDYESRILQLQIKIDLPVRQYNNNDEDRREDMAHNAEMTDMLNARKSRLHELYASLDSILKSKESLSRCKAAEETYMTEAHVVQDWISQKSTSLNAIRSSTETVEDLRAAVTAVGAIQSAVTNYTSSITSLKESATQCTMLVQSDRNVGGEDTSSILKHIQNTQSSIDVCWDQLCKTLEDKKNTWTTALHHSEYIQHIESFHEQCTAFKEKVVNSDLSTVTEDMSNDWQNEIQQMDSTWIDQIRTRFSEEKIKCEDSTRGDSVTSDTLKEMNVLLTTALGEFDVLKTVVKEKTTEASHFRFKKEYFQSADALESYMSQTRDALNGLRSAMDKEEQHVIRGVDVEEDEKVAQHVADVYASICDLFDGHHEKYDELRSFYRFLQLNKVTQLEDVNVRQTAIEKSWKQLKSDLLDDKQYVDSVSRWHDLHRKLNEMQSEALDGGIFSRLNGMVLSEEENIMPTFLEEDSSLLKLLASRLSACWDIASNIEDDKNFGYFQTHYNHVQTELERADGLLIEKKGEAERHVDFLACQKQVQEVKSSVEKAVDVIQQRMVSLTVEDPSTCGSKEIEHLFRNYASAVATTESQQKKLMSQLTTVIEPAIASLNEKYPDDSRHGAIKKDVDASVHDLTSALEKEQGIHDFMRRVLGHTKSAEDITAWVDNCESAISQIAADHLDENEALLKIGSLRQKLNDFQHVIDSFMEISQNLILDDEEDYVILKQLLEVAKANTDTIEARRRKVHKELNDVESSVEKTARGIAIARKFKVITGMVGEARDYVIGVKLCVAPDTTKSNMTEPSSPAVENADESDDDKTRIGGESDEPKILIIEQQQQSLLSMLREPEVKDIQRNLLAMESDIKPQIEQELNELSTMIENCKDIDVTFTRQHEEVKESVASFFDTLSEKYVNVKRALNIGKYLSIADDIDILQSSLEEAVSKSASSTTTTLMGKNNTASTPGLSRTDLQAKLIELDARFKYYERKIVQHLSEAKEVASVIANEDGVEAHLKEMEQKWLLIKKQFKTRKIELSRTIDSSLDYKDGQQARIRKSSLPTRKASSLLRERGIAADLSLTTTNSRRLSPTASTSSSRSRLGSNNASSTTTGRYLTPPLQHQPSKSATYLKSTTKSGRLPIINKPPLNSYVADPHNDLDIEIGRIVNETPYRVKVKMVPGEVGRYWFGDLNPKLAYCRVLKSKMVMVRVGGGWTELSQFLRDHALLEGDFIPRSRRNTNNLKSVIPEEDEPKSPTIQEGFIETRRDLSHQPQQQKSSTTTSSSNSSRSTHHHTGSPSHSTNTSGYKHGDKFITLDQHGNQHEVKMRKVPDMGRSSSTTTTSNDFTRRRIARRKEKLTASKT